MEKVKLLQDFIGGSPAGTVLELDKNGNYCDPDSNFWVAASVVKEKPELFELVKE